MDIDRSLSPPANDKIVPDVYNILDAHVMKRTTTFNNMLRYRLSSQEKVISKHMRDAQRYIKYEKSRAVDSLNKIHCKLNAVSRIRDFDAKFFTPRTTDDDVTPRDTKGYQRSKNEDAICQRCYIHHLPLKKKFYTAEEAVLTQNQKRAFLTKLDSVSEKEPEESSQRISESAVFSTAKSPDPDLSADISKVPFHLRRLSISSSNDKGDYSVSTIGTNGWWMPTPQNQQFLWKDKCGRDVDLNKGFTPRLVSNEEWKNVVKNVCSRYSHHKS